MIASLNSRPSIESGKRERSSIVRIHASPFDTSCDFSQGYAVILRAGALFIRFSCPWHAGCNHVGRYLDLMALNADWSNHGHQHYHDYDFHLRHDDRSRYVGEHHAHAGTGRHCGSRTRRPRDHAVHVHCCPPLWLDSQETLRPSGRLQIVRTNAPEVLPQIRHGSTLFVESVTSWVA